MDRDDEGLLKAMEGLGMKKAISKHVLKGCEDEGEHVPKLLGILSGVLQLMMVQVYSGYERAALRNEVDRIIEMFRESTCDAPDEAKGVVDAICDAYMEGALTAQSNGSVVAEKMSIATKKSSPWVLCCVPNVARCVVSPFLAMVKPDVLKKIASDEIPDKVMEAVVAGMKLAYVAPMSESVENSFRFHARQVLIERAKRKISGNFTEE